MRPTLRGYAALALVAALVATGLFSGPDERALDAMAAPVLVAIAAAAVQVYRTGPPTVERSEPRAGFPSETRTVELTVEGGGVGHVTETVGDGLSGTGTIERALPASTGYEVTYERRGVHALGPTTVRVRDALGLVEARYEVDETTSVVVYPRVHSAGDLSSVLRTRGHAGTDRTEFDRLREYVPGDSLRDVHWKSSAKHDDLLVTEFDDPADQEAVTIAATCAPDHADEMATATASLFVAAHRLGLSVGVTVPGGTVARGRGETQQRRVLDLLARTREGDVPESQLDEADVRVHADESGVTVAVAERVRSFEDLTTARENPLLTEVVA